MSRAPHPRSVSATGLRAGLWLVLLAGLAGWNQQAPEVPGGGSGPPPLADAQDVPVIHD